MPSGGTDSGRYLSSSSPPAIRPWNLDLRALTYGLAALVVLALWELLQ
jgi:hypothetical protein